VKGLGDVLVLLAIAIIHFFSSATKMGEGEGEIEEWKTCVSPVSTIPR